ncbi:hypothetical protein [Neoroseomonas oryzicola]|uniref:Uncharacterized protein n=1 Tax=Neoroseomonas oryzicola TaxID=535904 RepID=A0A9X9WK98_9PROT|nr:hypothetical protein [Neoroseomonas oryzicola]MBR0660758.1 hypothetical protein [Neoroseomonas oryzicola]NKE19068.1 hypothetical protein [Neoroseomonas oryzicola]
MAATPLAFAQDRRPHPFMLMNLGPEAVVGVELSPAGEQRYGPSLIGRIELPAGSALHLTPPARFDCIADLRVRFADGRVEEHAREDLCQAQRVLRVPSAPR